MIINTKSLESLRYRKWNEEKGSRGILSIVDKDQEVLEHYNKHGGFKDNPKKIQFKDFGIKFPGDEDKSLGKVIDPRTVSIGQGQLSKLRKRINLDVKIRPYGGSLSYMIDEMTITLNTMLRHDFK